MRTISIGSQDFSFIRKENCFYIDKTSFISEWYESTDKVTLITRPRRFGKTLMLSTVKCFFSLQYAGCSDLFEGLAIAGCPEMMKLQGTVPVLSITFGAQKPESYLEFCHMLSDLIRNLFIEHRYIHKHPSFWY